MLEKITGLPRNISEFYGNVKGELKKVTWPSRREVYGTTVVVIVAVFFFGFYLFFVDTILNRLVQWVYGAFL